MADVRIQDWSVGQPMLVSHVLSLLCACHLFSLQHYQLVPSETSLYRLYLDRLRVHQSPHFVWARLRTLPKR